MQIKLVQELKAYSFEQFQKLFNLGKSETSCLLEKLMLLNIVRKGTGNPGDFSLDDLADIDFSTDPSSSIYGKTYYVFRYVGIIVIGSFCFFCYPKYIKDMASDKKDGYVKFRQIIAVIRKYQANGQTYSYADSQGSMEFNLLAYTLDMLQDYRENGLYRNDKRIVEQNGDGQILWNKTINEQNIYLVDGVPMYLDLYTANDVLNEEDIFRLMQQAIITDCCHKMESILRIIGIEPLFFTSSTLDELGSEDYLVTRIEQELPRQFVTRNQLLLRKMLTYFQKESLASAEQTVSLVGTTSFNLVWEEVCAKVMGDCRRETLNTLELQPPEGRSAHATLMDIIPRPEWRHYDSNKVHTASATLIPDLITVSDQGIAIYDAKYYRIQLDEQGISHQPGVGDVTKQHLYELAYRKLAELNQLSIAGNAFLMPLDGEEEQHIGEVSINLFSGLESPLEKIKVILKPCEKMFAAYLEG